jgi:diacylglycerol O-acyltransferase
MADQPTTGRATVSQRRRLSTQDQFWLEMDRPNNLMVVDSVMWTATPLDAERWRDVMVNRLAGRYPVFRSLAIHDDDGSWWWQESPDFDIDEHISTVVLDDPDDPASLQRLIAENRTKMLDRSKPLWELLLVEKYQSGSAVVMRTHHSIADGVRMVELAMRLFDSSAEGGPVLAPGVSQHRAKTPAAASTTVAERRVRSIGRLRSQAGKGARDFAGRLPGMAREAAKLARTSVLNPVGAGHGFITESAHAANDAWHAIATSMQAVLPGGGVVNVLAAAPSDFDVARKLVLGTRDDPTIWTGHATTKKGVAWADPLPLDEVRAVAKANNGTINDVLVSCLAGSLERYLRSHQAHSASTTFMVPVNLKPLDTGLPDDLGNAFALIYLELPTSKSDPLEVLEAVKRRMVRMKHGHEPAVTFKIQEEIAGLGHSLYVAAIDYFANRASGVLTNVPGPQMPLYLAGSKVEGIVGWAPVSGNQPMSLTIYSYDGKVIVGIAADTVLVPGFAAIVDAFAEVFADLKTATERALAAPRP